MNRIDFVTRDYACRIASTLPLRKGVSLSSVLGQVWPSMEEFWVKYEDHESRYNIECIEVEKALLLAPRSHEGKGRPPRGAMRGYVVDLVAIYERATGKRITRIVDPYAEQDGEKPHPFLAICVKATSRGSLKEDDMSYPRAIIRQVLRSRKTM